MNGFDAAVEFVMGPDIEGDYSNDPEDRGGETRYGISKTAHPEVDLDTLTREQAREIYRKHYWLAARCDEFPAQIGLALFDSAVNQGVHTAIRLLQQALRVPADGIVGPETLQAAQGAIPGELLLEFLSYRAVRYAAGNLRFQRGWFKRLLLLQRAAWSLA